MSLPEFKVRTIKDIKIQKKSCIKERIYMGFCYNFVNIWQNWNWSIVSVSVFEPALNIGITLANFKQFG